MGLKIDQKGQSAAEFVLIVPFLFLIFFSIIQLAYMAYVSLAVQRSAFAIARKASFLKRDEISNAFKSQLALSLLPIANLSSKTLLTILETKCDVSFPENEGPVTATIHYPMPIWVPLARNLFGEDLVPSTDYRNSPEGQAIQTVFSLLNIPQPDFSLAGVRFPVFWITYQATTYYEGKHT